MKDPLAIRSGRKRFLLLVGVGLVGAIVWGLIDWRSREPIDASGAEQLLRQSRKSLAEGEFDRAEEIASRISPEDPFWVSSQLVAGEAASRAGRFDDAIRYYQSIPRDGSDHSVLADYSLAEVYRHVGQLSDAIQTYAEVLRQEPDHVQAHQRLALLLELTGQRWKALPHYMALLRSGSASLQELVLLGDLERHMEQIDYLKQCAERTPGAPLVRSGIAAYAILDGDFALAQRLLKQVVEDVPTLIPAQAMLGELLVDAEAESFLDWHRNLPPAADDYPDIWFVRGLWAREQGKLDIAARCFWETVRQVPAHRRGNYHLGQVLSALGETSGDDFAERSEQLFKLSKALDEVLTTEGRHEPTIERVIQLLESSGRLWEVWAWSIVAAREFPAAIWPQRTIARVEPQLSRDTPRTLESANLALKYDLSGYPDHRTLFHGYDRERAPEQKVNAVWKIRFAESLETGLNFSYQNGDDPTTKGARVFEQNGGGVAVIDFDGDHWPDLYFTQGTDWETGSETPSVAKGMTDRLFRNLGGESFVDVTERAALENLQFGQGPTVGDFNNDGFPDLYVANIGQNSLFLNNGDGTFCDVTELAGFTTRKWTASCVMVDLNSDGLPDLFDVNYLTGKGVFTAICRNRACSPANFNGEPDDLYRNRGDGTFEHVSNVNPEVDAKGLGVVAVDLEGQGKLSLFIANDQVPNFLLRNRTSDGSSEIQFINEGFIRGLAYNEEGLPMACMGIAADDADGDGRVDFFVTNFKDEANTLYLQGPGGLFRDATRQAGLSAPSWPYVGWGTQFLDADLDGHSDLVLVNGNVDDYRDEGGQYHMTPQCFRNLGRGRFVELGAGEAGAFFGKKFLGRGLASLDWNRDGRKDFVVSNINDQASLVTNQSDGGHYFNVCLHATRSARDSLGALVTVMFEDRQLGKQLLAGDGYMASNERVLQFGLGQSSRVETLVVRWPSGGELTLHDLPVNITLDLVEGMRHATIWREREPFSFEVR